MIKNFENDREKMQESMSKPLVELKNKHRDKQQLLKLKIFQKESRAGYLNQKMDQCVERQNGGNNCGRAE